MVACAGAQQYLEYILVGSKPDELDEIIDEIAEEINVDIVDVVPESSLRPQQRPPGMMARRGLM